MIVEYDRESAIFEESNAFDSEPKGPYMDEPLADDKKDRRIQQRSI